MSDRLAVMNGGQVEQVGAPQDVYEDPETLFVADFLGVSNLMEARIVSTGTRARAGSRSTATSSRRAGPSSTSPARRRSSSGPERVELEAHGSPPGPNRIPGMVERVVYVGSAIQVIVRAATGESLQALVQNTGAGIPYEQGTPVQLHLPRRRTARPSLRDRRRAFPQGRGAGRGGRRRLLVARGLAERGHVGLLLEPVPAVDRERLAGDVAGVRASRARSPTRRPPPALPAAPRGPWPRRALGPPPSARAPVRRPPCPSARGRCSLRGSRAGPTRPRASASSRRCRPSPRPSGSFPARPSRRSSRSR